MKLYFHINLGEKNQHQIVTAAIEIKEPKNTDIQSCVDIIYKKLTEKINFRIIPDHFEVRCKKRLFPLNTQVLSLSNNADLNLKINADSSGTKKIHAIIEQKDVDEKKPKKVVNSPLTAPSKELLSKAKNAVSKKLHSTAFSIYQEVLNACPDNYEALFGITYIYFKAGRYDECIPFFEKLISKESDNAIILLDYAFALRKSKQESKAVSVISRCISDLKRNAGGNLKALHDANVALAVTLESMEQLPSAFQLYLSIAQMTEKQHVDALLGYARVGYKLGHVTLDDVFIVVLNAIALRKNDLEVQSFFADMIQEKGGFESLQKQMHEAWNDAAAVVYIATFLRECGVLNHCLQLLQHAYKLAPKSVDISLLTMHVMENLQDLDSALAFVADFVESKHDRQVVRKIDLSSFAKVIRLYLQNKKDALKSFVLNELSLLRESPKQASPTGSMANVELQLIAIYFTVIKIFFIKGELKVLPLLLELMKPLYVMDSNLHKTLIRNEQAFYLSISQIFDSDPPSISTESQEKIFVVGDSHVLPLSWRNFQIKETSYTTFPILLTGLKIWHLRAGSKFYTKRSYDKVVQQIPIESTCLFVLGEIDCREGVQRAVQKYSYDTIDNCVTALVQIYVKNLTSLQKRRKLKMIVHPVPAVLKETQETVKLFNRILEEHVTKASKLAWLDINTDLIDAETNRVKEEFTLDGAHLHPKYLHLVEKELEKCI